MKILYIATEPIYPFDTGARIRSYQLVKAIAQKHDVEVAYISDSPMADEEDAPYAQAYQIAIPRALSELSSKQKGSLLLKAAATGSFPMFDFYQGYEQKQQVLALMQSGQFDLVVLQSSYLLPLSRAIRQLYPEMPLILDAHNIEWRLQERMAGASPSPIMRRIKKQMAQNLRRWEQLADTSVDGIATVSDEEAEWWQKHCPAAQILVVPNGVDIDFFKPSKPLPDEPVISFCGSMSYRPNDEGALWFYNKVWPLLHERLPSIRWLVIGKDPSDAVQAMDSEQITVTGRVDDVRGWLEQSRLTVVPLLAGGGTRLKILEAMAMERVVVSTAVGAEGIDSGDGLLIADRPKDMADTIVRMLQSNELSKLGKANRQRVKREYSWVAIGEKMLDLVQKVTE